jgi:hypothetical protein
MRFLGIKSLFFSVDLVEGAAIDEVDLCRSIPAAERLVDGEEV